MTTSAATPGLSGASYRDPAEPGAGASGIFRWLRRAEAWLDARGTWAWIAAMVAGFIFVWPVGLALLAYMIWGKRMFGSACRSKRHNRRHDAGSTPFGARWSGIDAALRPSGNAAFDAYKSDTLRRLEEEQEAFEGFLQRLRDARDKQEFDRFMEDRAEAARRSGTDAAPGSADAGTAPPVAERQGEERRGEY
ncbi:DUF2852 domain-containing protein [Pseudogemmobacter sonorensis]|uniref:DUF2852 domain-containing protein n=1 Tax=Pseudogemmobacter sonorensis TaxID=2989681 RepID=UPI00369BB958